MHIEPGIVTGAKIVLSYATAACAGALVLRSAYDLIRASGVLAFAGRALIATVLTFVFFEILPHFPVGVSEVHFILGSTLFLLLGAAPAAVGLALGLLIQGLVFAPFDLPQYFINVTTLLVPLWLVKELAQRIIAPGTAYVDLKYTQALALSTAYQGGVVAWVAFWAFYGQGVGAETLASVLAFGGAYMLVVIIEPLADLAVLAAAKSARDLTRTPLFNARLHSGS